MQTDNSLREFYKHCSLIYVDGMALVWMAQALGHPVRAEHRVAFLDWYDEFFHLAATRKWRIFYLGGAPESSQGFEDALRKKYPGIEAAVHHGYVREFNVKALCDRINEFNPHVLLVGMGMTIQEKFILDALPYLKANLVFAGGAMLEYLTGEQKPAPRWMGRMGLEWLFRLVQAPRRLGHRYLVEPVKLLPIFLRELLQARTRARKNFAPHA
jgi:N-acetylglucosaminyldiphosphoundecaprenol N-acetyl-beta-D-mannosaminyltransferase